VILTQTAFYERGRYQIKLFDLMPAIESIDFFYGDLNAMRIQLQRRGDAVSTGRGLGEIVFQPPDDRADFIGAGGEAVGVQRGGGIDAGICGMRVSNEMA
jgi:hypothetical protein